MKKILKILFEWFENKIFPAPKGKSESLISHLKRTFVLIVLLTGVTYAVHHSHLLKLFENPALDAFVRLNNIDLKYTRLIDIDEKDFRQIFKGKRPLNKEELARILSAIAEGDPKVIVVDLDTEDPAYMQLRNLKLPCKVIWARGALPLEAIVLHGSQLSSEKSEYHKGGSKSSHEKKALPPMDPLDVLGSNNTEGIDYGFAITQPDENGWVRSYPKRIPILWTEHSTDPDQHESGETDQRNSDSVRKQKLVEEETLPWKAISAANISAEESGAGVETSDLMFKFSAFPENYNGYSAGFALEQAKGNKAAWKKMIENKIVLLGGTYRAAGDIHMTPVGWVDGVKLVGFAIESFLQNRVIRETNPGLMVAFDFLIGILCVTIAHYLPRVFALFAIPVLFPALVFVLSFVCFDQMSIWANFVPLLFGIWLHFLHDHVVEDREMRHELAELTAGKGHEKHQ